MGIRDQGREVVKELVKKFSGNHAEYTRSASTYNETLLRVDFLNPFLEALDWDVKNKKGVPITLASLKTVYCECSHSND